MELENNSDSTERTGEVLGVNLRRIIAFVALDMLDEYETTNYPQGS